MFFTNWLRRSSKPIRTKNTKRPQRTRLAVEVLEDRTVPSVTLQSALSVDSSGGIQAFGMAVDTAGNTYITGGFRGTADFDPANLGTDGVLTSLGSRDGFVAKYAPDNSLVWVREMGGSNTGSSGGMDRGTKIQVDGSGNVYVTGCFQGTGVFGSFNLTAAGRADAFVAELDSSGTFQWADQGGSPYLCQSAGVGVDAAGNVYALTYTSGASNASITAATWNSGTHTATITAANNFAAGQTVVISGMTPSGYNGSYTILSASASGFTYHLQHNPYGSGTAFGAATVNHGGFDVLKFNPSGGAVWDMSIHGGGFIPEGEDLAVSASGNVFVAGNFGGTVDFDPGSGTHYLSSTNQSGFVLKLNTNGQFGWVSPFMAASGSSLPNFGECTVESIALDGSGNVIVGGNYVGTVDFNPGAGTTNLPYTDFAIEGFITKLNSAGALVWAKGLESSGSINVFENTFVYGLAVDAAGNIYATGSFSGTVDFDPGPGTYSLTTAADASDVFVMKLDSAGNFDWADAFGGTTGGGTAYGIAVDSAGTIYLAGYYTGTVNFSPDPDDPYWLTDPGTTSAMFFITLTQS